jgi:molecular chaperone DnaK (HSP70)
VPYPYCYKPIIRRNSALPLTRTERFYTGVPYQKAVEICVYEGEDEDALRNILIGDFTVEGLKEVYEPSEILCRMSVDLDGILHVTAIEKCTGKSKHVTIARAFETKSEAEIAEARKRLASLYSTQGADDAGNENGWDEDTGAKETKEEDFAGYAAAKAPAFIDSTAGLAEAVREGRQLAEQARRLLEQMHEEDREEVIDLNEQIEASIAASDESALGHATRQLRELLFFVAGKNESLRIQ